MHTLEQIYNRATKVFNDIYTVEDVLRGNSLHMHETARSIAEVQLRIEDCTSRDELEELYAEIHENGCDLHFEELAYEPNEYDRLQRNIELQLEEIQHELDNIN